MSQPRLYLAYSSARTPPTLSGSADSPIDGAADIQPGTHIGQPRCGITSYDLIGDTMRLLAARPRDAGERFGITSYDLRADGLRLLR